MKSSDRIVAACRELLLAKKSGLLGDCTMPEDTAPVFAKEEQEERLVYFTLPMSLNYQRDSFKLWDAVRKTWDDPETRAVFSVSWSASADPSILRSHLMKYKVALLPNKHIDTWQRISRTILTNHRTTQSLIAAADNDFLKLRQIVQGSSKAGFPYLSGPKIFNYWCFILQEYGGITLKNSNQISIAPDTHIIKCSVRLGLIGQDESMKLSREEIAERWSQALRGSGLDPIAVHPVLWFWSRSGFAYKLASVP